MKDRLICYCNDVSEAQLLQAIHAGQNRVKTLCATTRAGTGCGSCIPRIRKLLASAKDAHAPEIQIDQERLSVSPERPKSTLTSDVHPRSMLKAAEITVKATEDGHWTLFIEDALDVNVISRNKAIILCTVPTRQEALSLVKRFAQYFRESARQGEDAYAFSRRIGIVHLRQILQDN
jgi:NAD(P)H-nitrite reductase